VHEYGAREQNPNIQHCKLWLQNGKGPASSSPGLGPEGLGAGPPCWGGGAGQGRGHQGAGSTRSGGGGRALGIAQVVFTMNDTRTTNKGKQNTQGDTWTTRARKRAKQTKRRQSTCCDTSRECSDCVPIAHSRRREGTINSSQGLEWNFLAEGAVGLRKPACPNILTLLRCAMQRGYWPRKGGGHQRRRQAKSQGGPTQGGLQRRSL
jgi:hypothetical protein